MTWAQDFLKVLTASRPPSWSFGPILFGIGVINSRKIPSSLTLAALQIFSLSIPLCIIVFGINDVYDYSTDRHNPRKILNGLEGGVLQPEYHAPVRISAYLSTIFILGISFFTRQPHNIITIGCLLFLGWQYSAPPLRLKEAPVIDSISNGLIVFLTWFCGFSFSGHTLDRAPLKGLVLSLCTSGIHALGAVIDVDADITAGQRTIATALGQRPTAIFSCVCYFLAATTEEPNSIFGVYLWAGTLIMLVPCLNINLAQRIFKVIVYTSIISAVIWICVRIGGVLQAMRK